MKAIIATTLLFSRTLAYQHQQRQADSDAENLIKLGASSYNGLNLVPQMGWNNWNAFGCDVNESLLLRTAQNMADFGLRDLGYNYIVLDDCWSAGRDDNGYLEADSQSFYPNFNYTVANADARPEVS